MKTVNKEEEKEKEIHWSCVDLAGQLISQKEGYFGEGLEKIMDSLSTEERAMCALMSIANSLDWIREWLASNKKERECMGNNLFQ